MSSLSDISVVRDKCGTCLRGFQGFLTRVHAHPISEHGGLFQCLYLRFGAQELPINILGLERGTVPVTGELLLGREAATHVHVLLLGFSC